MKTIAVVLACLASLAIAPPGLAQQNGPCSNFTDLNRVLRQNYVAKSPLLIQNIRLARSEDMFTNATAKVLNRSKRMINRACLILRYERKQSRTPEVVAYVVGLPINRIAPGKEMALQWRVPNPGWNSSTMNPNREDIRNIVVQVHDIQAF